MEWTLTASSMVTSWCRNPFPMTDPLWTDFPDKGSALLSLGIFYVLMMIKTVKQTVQLMVVCDVLSLVWRHSYASLKMLCIVIPCNWGRTNPSLGGWICQAHHSGILRLVTYSLQCNPLNKHETNAEWGRYFIDSVTVIYWPSYLCVVVINANSGILIIITVVFIWHSSVVSTN